MKVNLTVESGKHQGREIALRLPEVVIGRDERCNIQLDSDDVSRMHCTLLISGHEVILRDDGSSNGTYVNKRRLRGELQLEDGDSIQVGPQLFTIHIEDDSDMEGNALAEAMEVDDRSENATQIRKQQVIDPAELAPFEVDRINKRLQEDLKR